MASKPRAATPDTATLALLTAWRQEDLTDDPAAVAAAERDLAAFQAAFGESRRLAGELPKFSLQSGTRRKQW